MLGGDFRVHCTEGLRVVAASVFPRIPGFFIVSAVYMVAEKGADVILASLAQRCRCKLTTAVFECTAERCVGGSAGIVSTLPRPSTRSSRPRSGIDDRCPEGAV